MLKISTLLLSLWAFSAFSYTILIDPGHGGKDTGAIGYFWHNKKKIKIYEKDIALKIAQKVKEKLSKNNPSYSVYLSRSIDRTVSLEERAEMAESLKSDLFISIHLNSSRKRASGFEIYYLDNHQDEAVNKVEEAENQEMGKMDPSIQKILIDLVIKQTVVFSKELAEKIHVNLAKTLKSYGVRDRGVKAGLFYVLALSKRPGVLIEVGFISNGGELKKINQDAFVSDFAGKLAAGIHSYAKKHAIKTVPLL